MMIQWLWMDQYFLDENPKLSITFQSHTLNVKAVGKV